MNNSKPFLIFFIFINILSISNLINANDTRFDSMDKQGLKNSQGDNSNVISIEEDYDSFIWLQGYFNFSLRTNLKGEIKIIFVESSSGGQFFPYYDEIESLKQGETTINKKYLIKPSWIALPGNYKFSLIIRYNEEGEWEESNAPQVVLFYEEFEIILGSGYLFLICALSIALTAIIIVLTQKEEDEGDKSTLPPSIQEQRGVPQGKIKCPECKKIIEEGLTFCPECGNRIPEFLKYNPNNPNT